MLIANTIEGNLKSKQPMNASWLVTTIKATLKTPIQISRKPIFLFRRTHEAAVRSSKILAAFKGDLGAVIAAHKDRPVNYRSEFRDTTDLAKLFLHHKDKPNIINIIQQGSRYHLDPNKKIRFRRNHTQGKL